MSIINDALKKTQLRFRKPKKDKKKESEEPQKSAGSTEEMTNVYEKMYKEKQIKTSAFNTQMPPEDKPSSKVSPLDIGKKVLKALPVFIFLIASLYVFFVVLSRNLPVKDFMRSAKIKSRSSQLRVFKPTPKKRVYSPGELILNGTSLMDGKKVALINDEIYELGDVIEGRKITSIIPNEVELRDDEKIITIKVR